LTTWLLTGGVGTIMTHVSGTVGVVDDADIATRRWGRRLLTEYDLGWILSPML
jgi:hypothetical protein